MGGGGEIPDMNKAAVAGAMADLKNYPFTYIIDALAKTGGKRKINGREYNFTGLGDADNAAAISDKSTQALLDIQKNYGADYVKQRLEELKRSDPTGYAGRQQLFDKIMADADANPNRPLADGTQQQIMDLLSRGGKLSDGPGGELEQVQQGVRGQQIAKGNYLGNAAAGQEAAAVESAGEQKRTQRQEQAIGYQTSGISPDDIKYRRLQQSLSELGAFISGTNPEAQFSSLSSAGNGAAPFATGAPIDAATNPNAALFGQQNAATGYAGQSNWNAHQVNPFLAGINGLLQTGQVAAGLGWNPFSTSTPGPAPGSMYNGPGNQPYTSTYWGSSVPLQQWTGYDAPSASVANTA
jgi:hypothetical protein